jgi:Predicted sugar kinase
LVRKPSKEEISECVKSITKWYQALHAVVIGPGFGRDDISSEYIEDLFINLKEQIAVCDADFLWFMSEKNKESLIEKIKQRSKLTILTPNEVEFSRLWKYFKGGTI